MKLLVPLLTLVLSTTCCGEEGTHSATVPLNSIWGYDMPGTRDAHELDQDGSIFMQIRKSLWSFPKKGEEAQRGFAVLGNGPEALREVFAVLVEKKESQDVFPTGSEISVMFFAYQSTLYVHLSSVHRQGNTIEVHYRFIPHETEDMSEHFALIPLGELSSGTYHVKMIQAPMDRTYVGDEFQRITEERASRIVCHSFDFSVAEQGE